MNEALEQAKTNLTDAVRHIVANALLKKDSGESIFSSEKIVGQIEFTVNYHTEVILGIIQERIPEKQANIFSDKAADKRYKTGWNECRLKLLEAMGLTEQDKPKPYQQGKPVLEEAQTTLLGMPQDVIEVDHWDNGKHQEPVR